MIREGKVLEKRETRSDGRFDKVRFTLRSVNVFEKNMREVKEWFSIIDQCFWCKITLLFPFWEKKYYLSLTTGSYAAFALRVINLHDKEMISTCNGGRTEWSAIRSVIIWVITKSDDRAAEVQFVYHEYDYRTIWTTRKSSYQLIIKITISEKRRGAKLRKKGKICINSLTKEA